MKRFEKKVLVYLLLAHVAVMLSCGNVINENVFSQNDNSASVAAGSGVAFTELGRNFSSSGDIRIEKSGDEGYYIAGTVTEDSADSIWFSLIDKNGRSQTDALLRSGYDDRVRRVKAFDNDNLIIYADRYYDDGDIDFVIAKVNRKTGIMWDYCFGDETKNRIFDVTGTDDGGAVLTGLSYYQLLGIMCYTTFMMKIDSSGKCIWEKDYRSLFSVFMPSEIRKLSDSEFLVSGLCLNRITNKFKTFFARIDNSGSVMSSVYINAVGMHSMLIGTLITADDSFTGAISLTGGSGSDSIVIAAFDRELNVQSFREYVFPDFNVRGKLVKGNDDNFIVAGMLNNSAGNGLYFLKFSQKGVLSGLSTKYYDEAVYELTNAYFSSDEYSDGLLYLCRYKDSEDSASDRKLFLDRVDLNNGLKSYKSPAVRSDYTASADYETGGVELITSESSLVERGGANLSLIIN